MDFKYIDGGNIFQPIIAAFGEAGQGNVRSSVN